MGDLRDYQHRKLDLADTLRSALAVARAARDEVIEGEIRALLSRLAEDRFTLAVIGQFSRGKSTLMNAILGHDYLPTGVLPLTSVITTVRYGSRARASYLRRGGSMPVGIGLEDIAGLVSQSSRKRAELQVTRVDIELPAEILRLGFTFVDTPGIGSAIGVNSASTRQFLPEADAVIFVTAFDSALTSAEAELLGDLGRSGIRVFCVINKRDLVDERASSEITAFVRRVLADSTRDEGPSVFPLSALNGLEAKLRADPSAVAASGLAPLESSLEEFLTTGRAAVFLDNLAARSIQLILRQRRDLRLGLIQEDSPGRARETATAFRKAMDRVRAAQSALVAEIRERVEAELPARLAERSPRWSDELAETLIRPAEGIAAVVGDSPGEDDRQRIQYEIVSSTGRAVGAWVEKRCAEVTEAMIDLAADRIGRLIELARSPGHKGAELAGVALPEDATTNTGWTTADVPLIAVPGVSWSPDLDAGTRRHLRSSARADAFQKNLPDALRRAASDAVEQACRGFTELVSGWAQNLLAEIERRTARLADRFEQQLQSIPAAEDLEVLDELLARLTAYRGAVSADGDGTHSSEPGGPGTRVAESGVPGARASDPGGGGTRGVADCAICRELTEGLFAYLSNRQLGLATREHDQAELAATNGFCSLHTWAYHATASPLGISAGYARLADTVAARLEDAAGQATDARGLGARLDDLVGQHSACPICAELASIQERAVRRSAGAESQAPPTLCAEHLVRVLEAGPPAEYARALVLALAARLRRDAEDMRSYALKREALHRSLLTQEESRAHLETLRLLAGDPALARASIEDRELSFGP